MVESYEDTINCLMDQEISGCTVCNRNAGENFGCISSANKRNTSLFEHSDGSHTRSTCDKSHCHAKGNEENCIRHHHISAISKRSQNSKRKKKPDIHSGSMSEKELDKMAEMTAWTKISSATVQQPARYLRHDGVELQFWLPKGTMRCDLKHGKAPYHKKGICLTEAARFFEDPEDQVASNGEHMEKKTCTLKLNEAALDEMAAAEGWSKICKATNTQNRVRYERPDGARMDFWLSTGMMGSYLNHPKQGKTQLYRPDTTMKGAEEFFKNPRRHTGRGYQRKKQRK